MATPDADTDELLRRAGDGDRMAVELLLATHRSRLRRMVAVRMDTRLVARMDPSDVVQEALMDAVRKLPEYLRKRSVPFYPWLRQIAWERLIDLHRRHIHTRTRSVTREERRDIQLPDKSAMQLAGRLVASGTSPSGRLLRQEMRERVRVALDALPPRDREVLVLIYMEQLSAHDIAAVLGISAGAVNMRHLRAIERLRGLLDAEMAE